MFLSYGPRLLLDKGGPTLKPFLPQLQTTFVKALSDPTFEVREQAAIALGKLMSMHTRVDLLVTELMSGINEATGGVLDAMLNALQRVLLSAGDKVKPEVLNKIAPTLFEMLQTDNGWCPPNALFSPGGDDSLNCDFLVQRVHVW